MTFLMRNAGGDGPVVGTAADTAARAKAVKVYFMVEMQVSNFGSEIETETRRESVYLNSS